MPLDRGARYVRWCVARRCSAGLLVALTHLTPAERAELRAAYERGGEPGEPPLHLALEDFPEAGSSRSRRTLALIVTISVSRYRNSN